MLCPGAVARSSGNPRKVQRRGSGYPAHQKSQAAHRVHSGEPLAWMLADRGIVPAEGAGARHRRVQMHRGQRVAVGFGTSVGGELRLQAHRTGRPGSGAGQVEIAQGKALGRGGQWGCAAMLLSVCAAFGVVCRAPASFLPTRASLHGLGGDRWNPVRRACRAQGGGGLIWQELPCWGSDGRISARPRWYRLFTLRRALVPASHDPGSCRTCACDRTGSRMGGRDRIRGFPATNPVPVIFSYELWQAWSWLPGVTHMSRA